MIYILLLASVSVALAADAEVPAEPKPAESALPVRVHQDERHYKFEDGLELIRHRGEKYRNDFKEYRDKIFHDDDKGHDGHHYDYKSFDEHGPVILRSPDPLPSHGHPDIERQNKIIADVYSPDYHQPTWILDYRYQKTGGRDYTRGPGGQILILPKGVRADEHKEFPDFDSLLEHLRLSRLSEHARSGSYRYDHDAGHGYHYNPHHRGHQSNWWKTHH